MPLQFDGNGNVTFPEATATGDYSITITFTMINSTQIVVGDNSSTNHFIACFAGPTANARISGSQFSTAFSGTLNQQITLVLSRTGIINTLTVDGTVVDTRNSSGDFVLSAFGSYLNGALKYTGIISGICTMTGFSGGTRTYNFDGAAGSTTLVDTTSGQNGTLTGFTTGGFTGSSTTLTLTSPVDFQCRKRDSSGQATFNVAGTTTSTSMIQIKIGEGAWTNLSTPSNGNYTGTVTVTGQQDVSVRASDAPTVTATAEKVTAAEIIALWGQSNEAGRGTTLNTVTVSSGNPTPIKYRNGTFSKADDATGIDPTAAGSIASHLAQIYSNAGIPVCIGNVAQGGSTLIQWLSGTTFYTRIANFATAVGGLSFTSAIIGETDSSLGTSQADVLSRMTSICTSLNTDYGTTHYLTYFPVGSSTGTDENVAAVRAGFAQAINNSSFIRFGGDLSTIPVDDALHIQQAAKLQQAATLRYNAFNSSVLSLNITGIPDGSYMTVLDNDSGTRISRESRTYSNGVSTGTVVAPVGTRLKGYVDDNLTSSVNGAYIETVTT